MEKATIKYMRWSTIYAVLALACGVFYREYTRFMGFTGKTTLSVLHTHYLALGMLLFLLLVLLERELTFTGQKTGPVMVFYHVGLNLTVVMLAVRGILQVKGQPISSALNASVSGLAGIGHILLGISLVVLLRQVWKAVRAEKQ